MNVSMRKYFSLLAELPKNHSVICISTTKPRQDIMISEKLGKLSI